MKEVDARKTAGKAPRSMNIQISLRSTTSLTTVSTSALLDSGATGMFISKEFVHKHQLPTTPLLSSVPVRNVDGTQNRDGPITEEVDVILSFGDHSERCKLAVANLGQQTAIIGFPWLLLHNPEVDWIRQKITMTRCPPECRRARAVELEPVGPEDEVFVVHVMTTQETPEIQAVTTPSQQLAEEAWRKEERSAEDMVPETYHPYKEVFSKEAFRELPPQKPWDHAIDLLPKADLPRSRTFPLSQNEQKELDEFLRENLANGRIQPSKSPMGAPVFFVKKKDGSLRLVQDYRKLNEITVKNSYPLPLVSDVLNRLRGSKYFSVLDLRWGFNNVRIKEGHEWKAAFRTNRGLFEPLVMFFGLCNSPATFQTMMNDILREFIDRGVAICYMDDILIFTPTLEEHRQVVSEVLGTLQRHRLFLKPEKCRFEQTRIEYLGLVISENQVEMDPVKIRGVVDWPVPKKVKDVQSFLGFVNFYRKFIRNFSEIARPLNALTRKSKPWRWGREEQEGFDALKKAVTSAPVLAFPSDRGRFRLECDASNFATGAILSQLQGDQLYHPVGFMSRSLNDVERNYQIHDKEMLAIIRALEEWRHFLEGSAEPFEVFTDHRNLSYFREAQKLNRRQARWSLYLSRFDFTLTHRPGKLMKKADALSRRADHPQGEEDNSNVTLLRPDLFRIRAAEAISLPAGEERFLQRIRRCRKAEGPVASAIRELESGHEAPPGWESHEGLVLYQGKVYVPQDPLLRHDIVHAHHDTPVAGHPGRWKTLELVSRNYWWPGLSRYVARYVAGCDTCQRVKSFPARKAGKLMPNKVPDRRWQVISVDVIGELPLSQGFDAIMVVVDRLSKRIHTIPTTTQMDSVGVARLFLEHVWRHHGLPDEVISDRGTTFISKFSRELSRLLGIKPTPSTAYHPQTDGQTERVNQEVETYLRIFVNHRQDDWADWLPIAEFSYNNRIHSATHHTPFELDMGQHPRMGVEPPKTAMVEAAADFVSRMAQMQEEAKAALARAAEEMSKYYDRNRDEAPKYSEGEKVWLSARNHSTDRPTKKLDHKWLGPFKILKVVSRAALKLQLPKWHRMHPVVSITDVRKYQPDEISERPSHPKPGPTIIDGGEEYEVEKILDSKYIRRRLHYYVQWKGYPSSENSWIPDRDTQNAPDLVTEFHQLHPSAPAPHVRQATPRRSGIRGG